MSGVLCFVPLVYSSVMNLKNSRALAIGVAFALLILGGFVFFRSPSSDTAQSTSTPTIDFSTSTQGLTTSGDSYTVSVIPTTKLPPTPQINRPLTLSASFSQDQKDAIQKAAGQFEQMLVKNPQDAGAWTSLGTVRKIAEDYEGARIAWEYVTALAPKNATPLYNLADLYTNFLRDYARAEGYYKKVIALNAADTNAYRGLFQLYSTLYKRGAGAPEDILKQGIIAAPDTIDLRIILARYYKSLGRMADAAAAYSNAYATAVRLGKTDLAQEIKAEEATL